MFLAGQACTSANIDYKACNSYLKLSNIPHHGPLETARLAIQPAHVLNFVLEQIQSSKTLPHDCKVRCAGLSKCKSLEQARSALSEVCKVLEIELKCTIHKIDSVGGPKKCNSFELVAMQTIRKLCHIVGFVGGKVKVQTNERAGERPLCLSN